MVRFQIYTTNQLKTQILLCWKYFDVKINIWWLEIRLESQINLDTIRDSAGFRRRTLSTISGIVRLLDKD
jgi:hypothetical protein